MAANPFDNPDFRKEMGDLLKETIAPIAETQTEHGKRLNEHDTKFREQKMAVRIVVGLGALVVSAVEGLAHWKWSK